MIISLFNNLIENAISFTSKGYIEIGLNKKDGNVIFYVKDTGKGIKAKNLNNIFFPFYKEDLSTSGTGVGLDTCKNIVSIHKGKINVYSKSKKGSTFEVIFPTKGANKK